MIQTIGAAEPARKYGYAQERRSDSTRPAPPLHQAPVSTRRSAVGAADAGLAQRYAAAA